MKAADTSGEKMPSNVIVLPRQNDDDFKTKVCRKLKEQFWFPLSITIILYKPQGRPMDGIEEHLGPVLRATEGADRYLLIIVHDIRVPEDILCSLRRKWRCDVLQWRDDADWTKICEYLGGFCQRKRSLVRVFNNVYNWVCVHKRKVGFILTCSVVSIFIIYGIYRINFKATETLKDQIKELPQPPQPPQPSQPPLQPPPTSVMKTFLKTMKYLYDTMNQF